MCDKVSDSISASAQDGNPSLSGLPMVALKLASVFVVCLVEHRSYPTMDGGMLAAEKGKIVACPR